MLPKLLASVDGYKTYIVAVLGIVIALVGHFWGPITISGVQIPKTNWTDVWTAIQLSGLGATLRHAIAKGN